MDLFKFSGKNFQVIFLWGFFKEIKSVKLVFVVEGNLKAPFLLVTTLNCSTLLLICTL